MYPVPVGGKSESFFSRRAMWDKVPETNDSERETPMSRPAAAASQSLPFELVFEDGIPMDDFQHPVQMALCRELTHEVMAERGRRDYTVAILGILHTASAAHSVVRPIDPAERHSLR